MKRFICLLIIIQLIFSVSGDIIKDKSNESIIVGKNEVFCVSRILKGNNIFFAVAYDNTLELIKIEKAIRDFISYNYSVLDYSPCNITNYITDLTSCLDTIFINSTTFCKIVTNSQCLSGSHFEIANKEIITYENMGNLNYKKDNALSAMEFYIEGKKKIVPNKIKLSPKIGYTRLMNVNKNTEFRACFKSPYTGGGIIHYLAGNDYDASTQWNVSINYWMEIDGSFYIEGSTFFLNASSICPITKAQLHNSSRIQSIQWENESACLGWGLWNGTQNNENLSIAYEKGIGDSDDYANTSIWDEAILVLTMNDLNLNNSAKAPINISPHGIFTIGDGRFSNAGVFGETPNSLTVSDTLGDLKMQDFTVEFWINNSRDYDENRYVLYFADSGYLRCEAAGDCASGEFCCYIFDGNPKTVNITAGDLDANTWYHITWVYNFSNNMAIFLDGVHKDSIAIGVVTNIDQTNKIGGHYVESAYWNGSIDQFIVWNRSLSSFEISMRYNNSIGKTGFVTLTGVENFSDTIPPSIADINITPQLNLTYFGIFNISVNISDSDSDIDNVTLYYQPINGDDSICHDFLPNGTCLHNLNTSVKLFNVSTIDIYYNDTIFYDGFHLVIAYDSKENYEDNPPEFIDSWLDSYHIFNITNNFTIVENTTLKIDIDIREKSGSTQMSVIYIVGNQVDINYFDSTWAGKSNSSLIRSIPISTPYDYTDGESNYYQVILQDNGDGTFTVNNLNLSNSYFIIVGSLETEPNNSWNLSFLNTTFSCEGEWYIGNISDFSFKKTIGCPNIHIHNVRDNSKIKDGLNVTICANDTQGNSVCSESNFFFTPLGNLPPSGAAFLSPQNQSFILGDNININWSNCIDPNGDSVNYSSNITNLSNQFVLLLSDNSELINFNVNSSLLGIGNYTINAICFDSLGATTSFNHSSSWDNFTVIGTTTTILPPVNPLTEFRIIVFDLKNYFGDRKIFLYNITLPNNLFNGSYNLSEMIVLQNNSNYSIFLTPRKSDIILSTRNREWFNYVMILLPYITILIILFVIAILFLINKKYNFRK